MSSQSASSSRMRLLQHRRQRTTVRICGAIILIGLSAAVLPWVMWAYQIDRACDLIEQGARWPTPQASDTLPTVSDPQRLDQAREALVAAIRWRPGNAYAYRLRGRIALAEGRWEEAETTFAEARRLAPTNPLIAWEQALAHEQRHGMEWMPTVKGMSLPDAVQPASNQDLRQLWRSAGLDMEQFILRGEDERAQQRFAEALRWYERASVFAPQAGIPWYYAALVYEALGQNDQALLAYQQATKLQPDFRDAWYGLGKLHMSREEWPSALAALTRGVQGQSGEVSLSAIYYSIGQVRQYFLDPPDSLGAEQAYDQALAAQPPPPNWLRAELHYQQARVMGRQGRWADAVENYQQSLALRPDFAPAYSGLANAFWQLGDSRAAQQEGRRAIELAPTSIDAYRTLAVVYESEGDFAQARDFYKHMLSLQPNNQEALNGLERLKLK